MPQAAALAERILWELDPSDGGLAPGVEIAVRAGASTVVILDHCGFRPMLGCSQIVGP